MLDLIISGGRVIDGTGAASRRADVGINNGLIAAIGDLRGGESREVLIAQGLAVAPGFIDIHSHSDFTLLVDPRAQSQVFQGVTTEVVGNCGHGCAPITNPGLFKGNIYGWTDGIDVNWKSFDGYMQALERARPAVNVASLVPNGNLRIATMDDGSQTSSVEHVAAAARILEESLEAGAWGYSTGLEYPSESATTPDEITALCRLTARYGGIYAAHTRNREVRAVEAVQEATAAALASGVRLQVSHINPRRGGPPGSLERCIGAVEEARAQGADAAFDVHTRLYGITNLSNALPSWAFEGGADSLRARLRDPLCRERLRKHVSIISSFALGGWDRVFLYSGPATPELAGLSFGEAARQAQAGRARGGNSPDPWDIVFDVLLAHADDPQAPMCTCLSYDEAELLATMRHDLCTIGSDATALGIDGPLAGQTFMGAFTWAGWLWRRMVVETASLSIEQAVARLTSAPARRMGIDDRGALRVGLAADIAVFDGGEFRETGTLESPNRLAEGMRHVVVNGSVTLKDGVLTDKRGGQVLRRGQK